MSELLQFVFAQASALSEEEQDELAKKFMVMIDNTVDLESLSEEHRTAIEQGLADVEAGRVHTQEEIKAFFDQRRAS